MPEAWGKSLTVTLTCYPSLPIILLADYNNNILLNENSISIWSSWEHDYYSSQYLQIHERTGEHTRLVLGFECGSSLGGLVGAVGTGNVCCEPPRSGGGCFEGAAFAARLSYLVSVQKTDFFFAGICRRCACGAGVCAVVLPRG